MNKIYMLNIRWVKTVADYPAIDTLLGNEPDWFRYNAYTWLIWTNKNASQLSALVRKKVADAEDSVMVIEVNPNDYWGWAPKGVWDWLDKRRTAVLPYSG